MCASVRPRREEVPKVETPAIPLPRQTQTESQPKGKVTGAEDILATVLDRGPLVVDVMVEDEPHPTLRHHGGHSQPSGGRLEGRTTRKEERERERNESRCPKEIVLKVGNFPGSRPEAPVGGKGFDIPISRRWRSESPISDDTG